MTSYQYGLWHVKHEASALGGCATRRRYFFVASRVPFGVEPVELPGGRRVLLDAAHNAAGAAALAEFLDRAHRGETPDLAEYAARFPYIRVVRRADRGETEDRIDDLVTRGRIAGASVPAELERKLETISQTIDSMSRRLEMENRRYAASAVPASVDELDYAVAEIMMRQSTLGKSQYHAAIFKFDKRVTSGWGARVNYTWSRLKDNQFGESNFFSRSAADSTATTGMQNSYDLDAEYAIGVLDVPHKLTIAWDGGRQDYSVALKEILTRPVPLLSPIMQRSDDGWEVVPEVTQTLAMKDVLEGRQKEPPVQITRLQRGTQIDTLTVSPDGSRLLFTTISGKDRNTFRSQMITIRTDGHSVWVEPYVGRLAVLPTPVTHRLADMLAPPSTALSRYGTNKQKNQKLHTGQYKNDAPNPLKEKTQHTRSQSFIG